MTQIFKDRILLCAAIAMGFGVSTGYPVGVAAAAGMPLICLSAGTRKAAFMNGLGYYVAGLWPIVPGLERYLANPAALPIAVVLWASAACLLSLPWAIAWTSNRLHYLWRAPLALVASIVPPLGIIGFISPLTAAGYLFPGTKWFGLTLVGLVPGTLLAAKGFRIRLLIMSLVMGVFTGPTTGDRPFARRAPVHDLPPAGWIAVNTQFGDVSEPFREFLAAQFVQHQAAESSAHVLVFPEVIVPRWSEATEAFWRRTLDDCRSRGQILVLGAGVPSETRLAKDKIQELSELRSYDFATAIDALETFDTRGSQVVPHSNDQLNLRPEPVDNTLLVVGAETATFYQRVPVPIGMWRPLSSISVPLRLGGPSVLKIENHRAAVLICYEQMLTFPILASMLQHPTVIVGISNTFWVDDTTIPRYQANALRSWAKLFRLPYLLAVNS